MHQKIDGKNLYIVEFDTMPELPITGLTEAEATYEKIMDRVKGILRTDRVRNGRYAQALDLAIRGGVITKPGKYGIHLIPGTDNYDIYDIID